MTYVDTSVLAAYYCPEPLSGKADRVLERQGSLAISWLVEVELVSALARKIRTREMRPADGRRVHALFQSHLEEGIYTRLALDQQHFAKAREWLATFRLRFTALDALHAAVAAIQGHLLLTADAALAKACARLGVAALLIG